MNTLKAVPVPIQWHPDLPIFACEAFLNTIGNEYGWLSGIDNAGNQRCILPYVVVQRIGFRMIRFPVETIPVSQPLDVQEEESFLNSSISHFRFYRADLVLPPANTALFRAYPNGAVSAPYGTVVNDLTLPEDLLYRAISRNHRRGIRAAQEAGVEIKTGMEYLEVAHAIISATLRKGGIRFKSLEEFRSTISALGENVKIFVATHNNSIQGCHVDAFSRHTGYAWYGGMVEEPVLGSMPLLTWESMKQFKALRVQRFNFSGARVNPEKGSKQDGIRNFKLSFGGSLVHGWTWKCAIDPLKYRAYCAGVRCLRGGDIVDIERSRLASLVASTDSRRTRAEVIHSS